MEHAVESELGFMMNPEHEIIHHEFDPEHEDPNRAVVMTISELEEVEPTDLPPLYPTIDDLLENLFEDPPAADAQAQITFTYAEYRVTMHQDGKAEFVKVA